MILRRMGNKAKIAKEMLKYFPNHKIYIEPFFGAGGMYFNKPKAKLNILNDLDSDVFNLFNVVMNQKEELKKAFYMMPIHIDLLKHWKKNKEDEPIKKALRFLFLSNLTFMGAGASLQLGSDNGKNQFYKDIDNTFDYLQNTKFDNSDFKEFLNKHIAFGSSGFSCSTGDCFIYCDPPYLGTDDNYSNSFNEDNSNDLFDCLVETECKFAMSEFDHPFIIEQAEKRGLNVIIIGERKNLKNTRTEILITNYENKQQSLFA